MENLLKVNQVEINDNISYIKFLWNIAISNDSNIASKPTISHFSKGSHTWPIYQISKPKCYVLSLA